MISFLLKSFSYYEPEFVVQEDIHTVVVNGNTVVLFSDVDRGGWRDERMERFPLAGCERTTTAHTRMVCRVLEEFHSTGRMEELHGALVVTCDDFRSVKIVSPVADREGPGRSRVQVRRVRLDRPVWINESDLIPNS